MRTLTTLLIGLGFFLTAAQTSRADEPKPPNGFRAIFNGTDLSGWHGLNPHKAAKIKGEARDAKLAEMRAEFTEHWRVEDGELVNDGHGPYATSDEAFGDFELRLEYKTVAGADSGIYLRGTPQVQIWDSNQQYNPAKPTRRPHLGSGGLFNNSPDTLGRDPLRKADKPFGTWNLVRIIQIGARTWVWLNGKSVVEGSVMENFWDRSQPLPAIGPVMLQTHGGEIRWRNIFVKPIPKASAEKYLAANPPIPSPTHYEVAYGPHVKQRLHFWKATSNAPTPLVLFIHGGGWMGGGRMSGLSRDLSRFLDEGISVASVEYRFIPEATEDEVVPPVKAPLHDAARALQFIRSKANEWNIDSQRIGASGGSAGACSSLWLAFHDDLADSDSEDPVARESTRLYCAAVLGAQTTLDPKQMKEWTPNSKYGGHAFGVRPFDEFLAKRDELLPWINEFSPYAHVSKDDPPIYMSYNRPPSLGKPAKDPTHTSNFGVKLKEHCDANAVKCQLYYPGAPDVSFESTKDYLIATLKG